jgi:putative Holliday junction resolvase
MRHAAPREGQERQSAAPRHAVATPDGNARAAAVQTARGRRHASATAASGATVGERSYLAFDYGPRRVGVACGNTVTRTATPITTVAAQGVARFAAIARLVDEWRPDALVVGIPRHPDGAPHENTERAERFARQLQGRFSLPVHRVDERYSTVEAQSLGAADVDAAAAAVILEQFMREQR